MDDVYSPKWFLNIAANLTNIIAIWSSLATLLFLSK